MNPLLTPSLRRVPRWGPPLALVLVLAVSGCYTQLSATTPSPSGQASAPATAERAGTLEGPAAARVGLNGVAAESYVAEHGDHEGAYDEYYYEDGYATDEVAVTRYHADADYYDAYYGGSHAPTYVSHHYYYPRWRRAYYAPVHFTPAWASFYDPYYHRPGWSFSVGFGYGFGWGSHIGFSYGYSPYHGFYDPWYSTAWYDPFFYDPFYASAWHRPHFARYSYSSGYRHGYSRGFLAGSFYSPYHHYSPQPGRYVEPPRGSVRSALDPYAARSRRSALASVTAAERGVRLDAPVGTRSARLLADDARQHVLTQRGTRLGDSRTAPEDRSARGVTDRAPRVGTQPPAGEAARGTRLGTPRADTATRPEAGTRTGAPPARGGRTATPPARTERSGRATTPESAPARPERSRWAQPPAPREETARPAPQRPATRTAPPPRTEERGSPPPPRQTDTGRQAPPPRETVSPPARSTPSVRQAPPPREESRPAPPAREETRSTPPPREETRPAPPPREEARPAERPARRVTPPPQRAETRQAPPPRQESRPAPAPAPSAQPRQAPPPRQATPAPSRDTARSSAPARPARQAAPQRRSGGDSGSRSSRSGRGGDDE